MDRPFRPVLCHSVIRCGMIERMEMDCWWGNGIGSSYYCSSELNCLRIHCAERRGISTCPWLGNKLQIVLGCTSNGVCIQFILLIPTYSIYGTVYVEFWVVIKTPIFGCRSLSISSMGTLPISCSRQKGNLLPPMVSKLSYFVWVPWHTLLL